jgi:hypothetical protein
MPQHLQLWRGDTTAKLHVHDFRTEGIVTKQLLGGDPDYVRREGLWQAVQDHIKPVCRTEQQFCRTSSFLSFTADYETAKRFAKGPERRELIPCADYDEQAVIFELSLKEIVPLDQPHVYRFGYACNYALARPNSRRPEAFGESQLVRCEFCELGSRVHSLILIDTSNFLTEYPAMAARCDALDCAKHDAEWLVLPTDYVPRLQGYQSRIPLADLWRVHLFRFANI